MTSLEHRHVFVCEFCKKPFFDKKEAINCETAHKLKSMKIKIGDVLFYTNGMDFYRYTVKDVNCDTIVGRLEGIEYVAGSVTFRITDRAMIISNMESFEKITEEQNKDILARIRGITAVYWPRE